MALSKTPSSRLLKLREISGKLCSQCQELKGIKGWEKLMRKCQAEQKFLDNLQDEPSNILESHLASTNLLHLQGIVRAAQTLPNVIHVLAPFSKSDHADPLVVDIVCNHGHTWVKVIARKPQALHMVLTGQGQYGDRSVVDHAKQYMSFAKSCPLQYKVPQVVFRFTRGVTSAIKEALECLQVTVVGTLYTEEDLDKDTDDLRSEICPRDMPIPTENELVTILDDKFKRQSINGEIPLLPFTSETDCHTPYSEIKLLKLPVISTVNLDVTALICLVSNVCHGRTHFKFEDHVLSIQATEEREKPVLQHLKPFLEGKNLIVCKTALNAFHSILESVGGEDEKQRAKKLLEEVEVVDDDPSERALKLKISTRINERSKIIFGTGETLKAVTLSANSGFIRAASNQGVKFAVEPHAARALTEKKEASATPLQ